MTMTALSLLVTLALGPMQEPTVPVSVVQDIVDAQDHGDGVLKGLLWASAMAGVADLSRSMFEFGAKRAVEANPLLRPYQDRPEVFALLKGAADSAVLYGLWRIGKKNRRGAILGAALYLGARVAVCVHNYRTAVRGAR